MRTADPFKPEINDRLVEAMHRPWPEQMAAGPDGIHSIGTMIHPDMWGDRTLPTAPYATQMSTAPGESLVSITRSPTGSGKTTNLPLFWLSTRRYDRIFVTQPRVIAARETAGRMAAMLTAAGLKGGEIVGYDTANEGNATPDNQIVVTTHGLTWQQMTHNADLTNDRVLVMSDEFHERDPFQDVLLEECLRRCVRTVIASATIDVARIAHKASQITGKPIPVYDLPGSPFKVEQRDIGQEFSAAIVGHARYGRNQGIENDVILAIVPRIKDVYATMSRIARKLPEGMSVVPVHGDMTPDEQARCFVPNKRGVVVVGTPILQTSLTVPNARVMVDSARQRVGRYVDGVKSNPIIIAPHSTRMQRLGRVGRTRDGIYEVADHEGSPPLPRDRKGKFVDAAEYDDPQITVSDPTGFVLRFAEQGKNMLDADLLDMPPHSAVESSVQRLIQIGAIASKANQALGSQEIALTTTGEMMAKIAIEPQYAAMIVEAYKQSPKLALQMMAAGAACQAQGVVNPDRNQQLRWRRLVEDETYSDVLAQLQLFIKGLKMTEAERRDHAYIEARFRKAAQMFERMATQIGMSQDDLESPSPEEHKQLRACIIATAPELFVRSGSLHRDVRGEGRRLSDSSIIGDWEKLIVGTPFDLFQQKKSGALTRHLITQGTSASVYDLIKYAPHRVVYEDKDLELEAGIVRQQRAVYFDSLYTGQVITEDTHPSSEVCDYLIRSIASRHADGYQDPSITAVYEVLDELRSLQDRTSQNLAIKRAEEIIEDQIRARYSTELSLAEVGKLIDVALVKSVVSLEKRTAIIASAPDVVTFEIDGFDCCGEVLYRRNKAYIKLPPVAMFNLPESFPELGEREVYVMFGNNQPVSLADALAKAQRAREKAARVRVATIGEKVLGVKDGIATDPEEESRRTAVVLKAANTPR